MSCFNQRAVSPRHIFRIETWSIQKSVLIRNLFQSEICLNQKSVSVRNLFRQLSICVSFRFCELENHILLGLSRFGSNSRLLHRLLWTLDVTANRVKNDENVGEGFRRNFPRRPTRERAREDTPATGSAAQVDDSTSPRPPFSRPRPLSPTRCTQSGDESTTRRPVYDKFFSSSPLQINFLLFFLLLWSLYMASHLRRICWDACSSWDRLMKKLFTAIGQTVSLVYSQAMTASNLHTKHMLNGLNGYELRAIKQIHHLRSMVCGYCASRLL